MMNCDMTSPKMWQTVCEHWHMPQYCYSSTARVQYSARVAGLTSDGACVFIASSDVTLDGLSYKPRCRIGLGYVDINEPCSLDCGNQLLSSLIGSNKANMSCLDNMLSYRLCDYNVQALANITSDTDVGNSLPSAVGAPVPIKPPLSLLSAALLVSGSIHYPYCGSRAAYQVRDELFHSTCNISCDHEMVNELFKSASDSQTDGQTQYTTQFWLFFTFMIVSWIGQAVVVTFADAICFNLLGEHIAAFSVHRIILT
ncbi:jg19018 [Pararge aegeria aegeria]|uniref:Jg19018 protein n=1 Tax=Pararge aegeria aegeria TaxID=348720 RepID=A0A8S4R257_9NEOP|nr:jg19018 [Pararge aegeria aegeria]